MRPSEVGGFHLAETGVSICNRNRIMTGLRFLFRVTLRRLDLATEIYHIREPHSHTRAAVRSFTTARSPNFRANTIAASASIQTTHASRRAQIP